jgi:hypothetical protein
MVLRRAVIEKKIGKKSNKFNNPSKKSWIDFFIYIDTSFSWVNFIINQKREGKCVIIFN